MQEALNGRVIVLAVVVIFTGCIISLHNTTQPRKGCGRDRNRTRGKGSKAKAAERYFGNSKGSKDKGKGKSKSKDKGKGKNKGYDRALGVTRLVLVIILFFSRLRPHGSHS